MFVIERDKETRKLYIRPVFVGFIRNDVMRRICIVAMFLPTLIVVLVLNLILWGFGVVMINGALIMWLLKMITKTFTELPKAAKSIWTKPRVRKGSLNG